MHIFFVVVDDTVVVSDTVVNSVVVDVDVVVDTVVVDTTKRNRSKSTLSIIYTFYIG